MACKDKDVAADGSGGGSPRTAGQRQRLVLQLRQVEGTEDAATAATGMWGCGGRLGRWWPVLLRGKGGQGNAAVAEQLLLLPVVAARAAHLWAVLSGTAQPRGRSAAAGQCRGGWC